MVSSLKERKDYYMYKKKLKKVILNNICFSFQYQSVFNIQILVLLHYSGKYLLQYTPKMAQTKYFPSEGIHHLIMNLFYFNQFRYKKKHLPFEPKHVGNDNSLKIPKG